MRLKNRYVFLGVCAVIFAIIMAVVTFTPRYSEAQATQADQVKAKRDRVYEIVTKLPDVDYNSRPRLVYEAYEITLDLANKGYIDEYSIDAAFEAVNYGVASPDKVILDFSNIKTVSENHDRMINDMVGMLTSFRKK